MKTHPHRYQNKRVGGRAANGRFAQLSFRNVFGIEANSDKMVCDNCRHQWIPLVMSGICPECKGTSKHPLPPPEITAEIQIRIDRWRELRPDGMVHPMHISELVQLERELTPWIKAGLVK